MEHFFLVHLFVFGGDGGRRAPQSATLRRQKMTHTCYGERAIDRANLVNRVQRCVGTRTYRGRSLSPLHYNSCSTLRRVHVEEVDTFSISR